MDPQPIDAGNLFTAALREGSGKRLGTLASHPGLEIETIVSHGNAGTLA